MKPYHITQKYGIYYARWQDIVIEAPTYQDAVVRIMDVIKEVVISRKI